MRRSLILAFGLALAVNTDGGVGKYYNVDISVTATNTVTQFTDNGSGGDSTTFAAKYILVRSLAASANTCYFDLKDGTASTSDIALEPGASLSLTFSSAESGGSDGWPAMGSICSAGQTATFRVTAYR